MKYRFAIFKRLVFVGHIIMSISLLLTSYIYAGDIVPNIFKPGDIVSASKMNQNFEALENSFSNAIESVTTTVRVNGAPFNTDSWAISKIFTVQCNPGEVLTGGNCTSVHADQDLDTTNIGIIASCVITETSVLGASVVFPEISDLLKFGPPITVQAICASAVTVDGIQAMAAIAEDTEAESTFSHNDEIILEQMEEQLFKYHKLMEEKLSK